MSKYILTPLAHEAGIRRWAMQKGLGKISSGRPSSKGKDALMDELYSLVSNGSTDGEILALSHDYVRNMDTIPRLRKALPVQAKPVELWIQRGMRTYSGLRPPLFTPDSSGFISVRKIMCSVLEVSHMENKVIHVTMEDIEKGKVKLPDEIIQSFARYLVPEFRAYIQAKREREKNIPEKI